MFGAVRTILMLLGTLLMLVGTVAGVVNREVVDAARFTSHVEAVRTDPDVARQLGILLTDRLLETQPDLTAVRPLLLSTTASVFASAALGPAVRNGVSPLHHTLVTGSRQDLTVLRLADAAAVVVGVLSVAAPQVRSTIPGDLDVRLSRFGGQDGREDRVIGWVHLARPIAWICPILGVLLLGASGAAFRGTRRERTWSGRLFGAFAEIGRGILMAAVGLSGVLVTVGFLVGRADRSTMSGALTHAVWDELDGPFWAAAGVTGVVGFVLTLPARREGAAGNADLVPRALVRNAYEQFFNPSPAPRRRALRALFLMVLGVALVLQPLEVARALLWATGLALIGLAAVDLGPPAVTAARVRLGRRQDRSRKNPNRSSVWVGAGLTALLGFVIVVGAYPSDENLSPSAFGTDDLGCNGHARLCGRSYDEVVYPATHNSMAAASEPGWFFAEQPDGIIAQLDHGIRVLLIDSWYGQATQRPGVVANTDATRAQALAESTQSVSEAAVRSALRLRDARKLTPRGPIDEYLCHGLCELGSSKWLPLMKDVRIWLESHPREVVTLFVQDTVSPTDTARIVRDAGLQPYVYTPVVGSPAWPTLGQMIDSGKRLVILMERQGGGSRYPWLMSGFHWVQDTPFLFRDPDQFSCQRNRGPASASLFLLNHWITDKTREVTNAARVNAQEVLLPRARECQKQRGQLPNFVAVDFYDRGDLMGVVDILNGVSSP